MGWYSLSSPTRQLYADIKDDKENSGMRCTKLDDKKEIKHNLYGMTKKGVTLVLQERLSMKSKANLMVCPGTGQFEGEIRAECLPFKGI